MTNAPTKHQSSYISFYSASLERTLRQFIEAFWFEGVLQGHLESNPNHTSSLHLQGRDEHGQNVEYKIKTYPSYSFGRHRLFGALTDLSNGEIVHDIATVISNLLRFQESTNTSHFIQELIHTAAKQAFSLQVQNQLTQLSEDILNLPYAWQEAQLGDGHLYHPCYRSRMGFSLADHQQYGPEFAQHLEIEWLGLDRRLADVHTFLNEDYTFFLQAEIGVEELNRLQSNIRTQGKNVESYYLLPIHPWHWLHRVQIHYADWLNDGRLLYLGTGKTPWLAQQSIRSLSSLAEHARYDIKLPLGIANSSADRILSEHHVHNAPIISKWLTALCAQDIFLKQNCRLAILSEPIGITIQASASRQDRYGLLGAIWRQSPTKILQKNEQIFPCTALTSLNTQKQLHIAPWLQQHGTQVWVCAFLRAILPPFLHLMIAHGVLLEVHAQNTLLILKDGLPRGVVIRDLPGGLHYIAEQTTNEAQLHCLRQAPTYRNNANASSGFAMQTIIEARDYLLEVLLFIHLSEFAHRLALHHEFTEDRFWKLAAQTVLDYQMRVPELKERLIQFNLFTPQIRIEKLASRRLSMATSQEFHFVPNPLHTYCNNEHNDS